MTPKTVRENSDKNTNAHGRIRTPDPKLRRLVLYPTELRAHLLVINFFNLICC